MEWIEARPNKTVERTKGKSKGRQGFVLRQHSPSGTFDVRYATGKLGKFCHPENFKLVSGRLRGKKELNHE